MFQPAKTFRFEQREWPRGDVSALAHPVRMLARRAWRPSARGEPRRTTRIPHRCALLLCVLPGPSRFRLQNIRSKDNRIQVSRWQPKSSEPSRGPSEPAYAAQPAGVTWAGLPGGRRRTTCMGGGGNATSTETPQSTWGCQAPRREGQAGTLSAASVQADRPGMNRRKLILILDELE